MAQRRYTEWKIAWYSEDDRGRVRECAIRMVSTNESMTRRMQPGVPRGEWLYLYPIGKPSK